MRGNSVKVRRSLRTRVFAACALAFLGLAAVVCLVLPQAYEVQARASFAARTDSVVRGLALLLAEPRPGREQPALESCVGWLVTEPSFIGAAVLDAEGATLARWPAGGPDFAGAIPAQAVVAAPSWDLGYRVIGEGAQRRVAVVRLSNSSLVRDLENVRWLFASIFLFTSVVFFILTKYLTRTILSPIEDIGRAARSLADGEPAVDVPRTGDREIDDLGEFITKLGESRRQSRVMMNPMEVLAAQGWGRHGARRAGGPAHGHAGIAPARPPADGPST